MFNASLLYRSAKLNHTFITFLDKCKSVSELKQIHALAIALGHSQKDSFASRVLSFTATSGFCDVDYAYRVFLQLSNPTTFNWNTIIRVFSISKNPNKAISVFLEMLRNGVEYDHLTFPFVVKASARFSKLRLGVSIHGLILKTGGDISLGREVFDLMPERDVVSWSSLIDGYVKDDEHAEALAVFEKMKVAGPKANEVTMVSVLCACAHLGALEQGRAMNRYMKENGLPITLPLRTSLVDMYAKCGAIEEALVVFRGAGTKETDALIWNAMIGGLATHGFVRKSLDMFTEMQIAGISPDEITYLCLLSACAHGGLVNEAWHFFESLKKCGMIPKREHYACMVDVLARAGHLTEAYYFLCQMPMEPTASMLGALLSGCMNHRRLDLAEIVGKKLIELEPDHDGRYVGLSNAYAVGKRWDEARIMREAMERRGVKKSPGCSFVEIFGALHRFIAHDKTHPKSEQIYLMLNLTVRQMKIDADTETQEYCSYDVKDM
ncbi:unnamed protein product [Ilex paraguariensis]|uniref:Pentatricopeptide repeat-containing protein n=1 Tax=Ilex paraguariensis TaxID=185542 RepID=A0ABC8QM55_9AQUA